MHKMKALIYNSGLGKRMGDLTKNSPKSMVKLKNGETIFHRQLRLLNNCGIKDIVVTTGPFKEQVMATAKKLVKKQPFEQRGHSLVVIHKSKLLL